MDSSGLGALHLARRHAVKNGGTLVVCRPQPIVHRVLQLTGLDTWIADWDPAWSDQPEGSIQSATSVAEVI